MVSELYGKRGGCCGGRGGSVHLTDLRVGVVASSAILGETIAVAVGAAEAFSMSGQDRVAVTYFGDGAVEEGIFHESLNYASVRRLPVLFACENNEFSVLTPLSCRQPATVQIHERARGYGMPARRVDGNDVGAVYEAAQEAVAHIRSGHGPYLLECLTYRWREHVGPLSDHDWGYRTENEVSSWIERCPIKRLKVALVDERVCTEDQIAQWEQEFRTQIEKAIRIAQEDSFPSIDTMMEGTY
jgi:pyruvate dehydrogenase E1 component alpha subunit